MYMQTLTRKIEMVDMLFWILLLLKGHVFALENMALGKRVFENNPWKGRQKWRGPKAVDGLYGDRSANGGQCVISENFKKTAEWKVDLGSVVSISHIDIHYRTDNFQSPTGYTARMAGFFLYVSNTTSKDDGHLCFHEIQNISGTPIEDQRIDCSVHGRYVIYYNERRQYVVYPRYYSEFAYYELCELEVYGCSRKGFYGENCNKPCPINCQDSRCDINTGHCLGCVLGYQGLMCDLVLECQPGYFGITCADRCSVNCYLTRCNRVTGHCGSGCNSGWTGKNCDQRVCQQGYYGRDCTSICSENCFQSRFCDRLTGDCNGGCKQGWTGSKCDQQCQSGYYGKDCTDICSVNCLHDYICDRFTGQCKYGCKPGWTGNRCYQQCDTGFYGKNCTEKCGVNCLVASVCDRFTGECTRGCIPGWTGRECNQQCQQGHYGKDCSQKCSVNCNVEDQCNRFNGQCDEGCKPGWTGITCDQKCDPGLFGKNCMQRCSVNCNVTGICDRFTGRCDGGCKLGWKGDTCDQNGFQLCDNGYFGAECNRKCGHCLQTDHCNHVNGSCLNGCLHGYKGDYCNETCPPGFFGLDCINRCDSYCSGNESCDPVLGICTEGCKRGWSGLICGLDRLNCQSYGDNMPIVVGVVVSVVIIFGGIIIHVILWKRKTGTTLQIPSDGQSGPSETSQHYTQLDIINKSSNYDEIHSHSNYLNL